MSRDTCHHLVQYLMFKQLSDNSILLEKSIESVEMKPSTSAKSVLLFYTDLIVNNVHNGLLPYK
jgi:hypothetical protein